MLENLMNYQGSGRKPDDFNEFWKKNVSKIKERHLNFKCIKLDIFSNIVDCFEMTFLSLDGSKISCQLLKPKFINEPLPGVVIFHGYHSNSGDFSDKIGWAAEGNVVLAMDCRGQGGLSEHKEEAYQGTALKGFLIRGVEQGPEYLYYKKLFLDTVIAVRILMSLSEVDENEITLIGSSQGGGLTLICAALEEKVRKVWVNHPFLCDYRKAYALQPENSAYEELYYWFRFRDPLHKKQNKFFETLEYIDAQHFASDIKAKVVMVTGLADTICYPLTQFAAYNKIRSPKKSIILPEYGHEHYPKVSDELRSFVLMKEKTKKFVI